MIRTDATARRAAKLALGMARDRSWSALPTHTYRYIRYADRSTVAEIVAKTMVEADAKLLIEMGIDAVTTPSIGCVRLDSSDDAKIVEMIAATIEATMADAAYPVVCFNHDVLGYSTTEETVAKELNRFGCAVLDKLKSEGVVR